MDNKFIKKLRGTPTPKSLLEIKDKKRVRPFTDMPIGDDSPMAIENDMNSSVIVAKSAQNWVLGGSALSISEDTSYISEFDVSGNGMWVNASYAFPASSNPANPTVMVINRNSKWVLRLCGKDLFSDKKSVSFTVVVKVGTTSITSKDFVVNRQASYFSKIFEIDFSENINTAIKVNGGGSLNLQVFCNEPSATAIIFNGMTVLTLLERKVDGEVVATNDKTFDEIVQDIYTIQDDIVDINEDIGDMNLPDINGITPSDLSSAVRNLNTQSITLGNDATVPTSGNWTIWGAITKAFNNIRNIIPRVTAIESQNIATITEDSTAPTTGNWTLWNAIRKTFNNLTWIFSAIASIFSRLSAVEGVGGVIAPYNFGKTFENPISADADIQMILERFILTIFPGSTNITYNTTNYALTSFADGDGNARTAAEIFNGTSITNTFDNTRIQLNNTQNTSPTVFEFSNQGILLVGIANQITAGVVRAGINSDIVVHSDTGDVQLDDTKGFSIWDRITSLFTTSQQAKIRSNLGLAIILPTGMIIQHAGPDSTPPEGGWLLCDGQAVSRTTYANLFSLIGENFGAGDGSTTFNVPDYRGAFLRGLDDGTLTAGDVYTKQLDAAPNITGSMSSAVGRQNIGSVSGAFTRSNTGTGYHGGQGHSNMAVTLTISASNSSASYGRDSTTEVRPMNYSVNFFIKT